MLINDYFFNGVGEGVVGNALMDSGHSGLRMDPGIMRPYFETPASGGRPVPVVTLNTGRRTPCLDKDGKQIYVNGIAKTEAEYEVVRLSDLRDAGVESPVGNATTLTKDQWILFDARVQMALRLRMNAWTALSAANPFGGFDGMASEILEYETLTDDGRALVDMDGLSEDTNDTSHFQLEALPLPITHSGFTMSKRRLMNSRGTIKTIRAEHAAHKVAEKIEQTLIGTVAGIQFGSSGQYTGGVPKVFGYTNHPDRMTKSDLTPSANITGEQFLSNVQDMIQTADDANFHGPFVLYVSSNYENRLGDDFKANSDKSTRTRILELGKIGKIERLDYLTGDQMVLVQMTSDVVEAVNGMSPQLVQWESKAGMQLNFKLLTIQVPWIKKFPGGTTGIVHATTS